MKSTGSAWLVGDISDPGLQHWLRRKVKTHLFISQARIEADDLVQEMNLHLLETLSAFPSSDKTWPHFCRSQVFRKIRHAHHPWASKTKQPEQVAPEAATPVVPQKQPVRAIPRPDPTLRLSRLLGSESIATVAKQTGIPTKTLKAPIARMRGAMQRRYPEVYGAPEHQIGYRGMIRWNPPSSLPQPQAPEPATDSGVVVWLNQNQPERVARRVKAAKTHPAKQTQQSQGPTERAPAKPVRKRQPARRRTTVLAQQIRREKRRALRRLARPNRRRTKPTRPTRTRPPRMHSPLPGKRNHRFRRPNDQHLRSRNRIHRPRTQPGYHRPAS